MKHPYHRINDEEDDHELQRETHRRQERREVIQAKKYIGSGEDAVLYPQLTPFNANQDHQKSHS